MATFLLWSIIFFLAIGAIVLCLVAISPMIQSLSEDKGPFRTIPPRLLKKEGSQKIKESKMAGYFICYICSGGLVGSCSIERNAPISNHDDIREIGKAIQESNGIENVVIINWKRFEAKNE